MAKSFRLTVLSVLCLAFGAIWEVDANRQQEIIGGLPVCDGWMEASNVSCVHPEMKKCDEIRGYVISQPILYSNNITNTHDTRCETVTFYDQKGKVTVHCYGGYNGWVEHGTQSCILDTWWDWL